MGKSVAIYVLCNHEVVVVVVSLQSVMFYTDDEDSMDIGGLSLLCFFLLVKFQDK